MTDVIFFVSLLLLANYYARILARWHVRFAERWYQMTHEERIEVVARVGFWLLFIWAVLVHP